jgi:hypothetical protein
VCSGQIGTAKFCIKPRAGRGCCDAASHFKATFPFPPSSLYLKENEICAWCEPHFKAWFLSPEQLHFLPSIKLPKEDWIALFDLLEVGVAPEWLLQTLDAKIWSNFIPKTSPTSVLPVNLSQAHAQTAPAVHPTTADIKTSLEIEILSPRFTDSAVFLQGFPSLSFDDLSQEEDAAPYSSLTPSQIGEILHKFTKRFSSLKAKWNSAFSDVEANYLVVVKNLTDLQQFANTVASSVVQPDPAQPTVVRSLWDQVQFVHSTAVDHFHALSQSIAESSANVTTITQDYSLLHTSVATVEHTVSSTAAALQQHLLQVETTLQSFDTRFARLLPILKHVSKPGILSDRY